MQNPESNMLDAYTACALWSTTTDTGENLDSVDAPLDPDALDTMALDVHAFALAALTEYGIEPSAQLGHDFWLTRNGHGSGFWDRPDVWGDLAKPLTALAESWGEAHLDYDPDTNTIYHY